MKKIIFILIFLFTITSHAQTVNGIPVSELDAKYIRINFTRKLLKPFQIKVFLDYGQIARIKDIKKGHVLDDDGKKFSFNGIMGVVNLLVTNGYEIAFVYNEEDDSVNYVMKKLK
jgi:hypothetical protein